MPARTIPGAGFKRQVVFRIGAEDWALLEAAAAEHGSIQAAILAGLHALKPPRPAAEPADAKPEAGNRKRPKPKRERAPTPKLVTDSDPSEEIHSSEAARLLGLKTSTVSGYIRRGRIAGRYDAEPTWKGWMTTRAAVNAYRRARA